VPAGGPVIGLQLAQALLGVTRDDRVLIMHVAQHAEYPEQAFAVLAVLNAEGLDGAFQGLAKLPVLRDVGGFFVHVRAVVNEVAQLKHFGHADRKAQRQNARVKIRKILRCNVEPAERVRVKLARHGL